MLVTDETRIYAHSHGNPPNIRYITEKRSKVPGARIPRKGLQVMVAGRYFFQGVATVHIILKGQSITIKKNSAYLFRNYRQQVSFSE